MKGIRILAVFLGWIVDLALSLTLGIILGIGLVVYLAVKSKHPGHFDLAAFNQLSISDPVLLMETGIGVVSSFVGGALTGWFAKTHRMKNVYALVVAELVFTIPFLPFMKAYPIWFTVGSSVGAVVFIILGGWISKLVFDVPSSTAPQTT